MISGSSCSAEKREIKNRKKRLQIDKNSYNYVVGSDTGTAMLCMKCGKVSVKIVSDFDAVTSCNL